MALVNAKAMIQKAKAEGYAIPQFNVNNLEWAKTILETVEKEQSPVILGLSAGAIKYMGGFRVASDLLQALDHDLKITVPVAIHLDHGHNQHIQPALDAGFTSIMFDGSHLSFAQNVTDTQKWVTLAQAQNVSVEAEVGAIGGEEDGIVGDAGEVANPLECQQIATLGIDFLAAGIGNIHGRYPPSWKSLDFATLQKIQEVTNNLPLVLHGGSGIPAAQVQKAIKLGVAKVNVNTELQLAYAAALAKYFLANKHQIGKGFDPRKINGYGMKAVEEEIINKIKIFGCGHKAFS